MLISWFSFLDILCLLDFGILIPLFSSLLKSNFVYLCWLSCLLMFNGYLILYMSILTRYILCISYLGVTNVFAPTVKLFAIVFWLTRTSMLCTFWTLLVTKLFSSLSTPCEILSLNKCCSVCFAIACFYASKLDLVNWATFVSI